jgi:hypothetical protein
MKAETKDNLAKMKEIDLENLSAICHYMYIARNITLDEDLMNECFKTIDRLYRAESGMN